MVGVMLLMLCVAMVHPLRLRHRRPVEDDRAHSRRPLHDLPDHGDEPGDEGALAWPYMLGVMLGGTVPFLSFFVERKVASGWPGRAPPDRARRRPEGPRRAGSTADAAPAGSLEPLALRRVEHQVADHRSGDHAEDDEQRHEPGPKEISESRTAAPAPMAYFWTGDILNFLRPRSACPASPTLCVFLPTSGAPAVVPCRDISQKFVLQAPPTSRRCGARRGRPAGAPGSPTAGRTAQVPAPPPCSAARRARAAAPARPRTAWRRATTDPPPGWTRSGAVGPGRRRRGSWTGAGRRGTSVAGRPLVDQDIARLHPAMMRPRACGSASCSSTASPIAATRAGGSGPTGREHLVERAVHGEPAQRPGHHAPAAVPRGSAWP